MDHFKAMEIVNEVEPISKLYEPAVFDETSSDDDG